MCKECERVLIPEAHANEEEFWVLQFKCMDCGKDTNTPEDYYMVQHEIWEEHGVGNRMLCIKCLETRAGREFTAEDFLPCMLNLFMNPYVQNLIVTHTSKKLLKSWLKEICP